MKFSEKEYLSLRFLEDSAKFMAHMTSRTINRFGDQLYLEFLQAMQVEIDFLRESFFKKRSEHDKIEETPKS